MEMRNRRIMISLLLVAMRVDVLDLNFPYCGNHIFSKLIELADFLMARRRYKTHEFHGRVIWILA